MHMHDNTLKRRIANLLLTSFAIVPLTGITSCAGKNSSNTADTATTYSAPKEYYHADNDIAMTVRSIADALKVGEPLDSTEYDFKGVLTDGQGAPLYTDVQGSPGLWVVDVLDPKNASIKNIYLGDLLPGDLQSYILQSLRLSDHNQITFTMHESANDDETQISIYDFGGGFLRFEIRAGIAPNGLEGPLMTIVMSTELPPSIIPDSIEGEKQKAVLAQNAAKP